VGIYKSFKDTSMSKLGTRGRAVSFLGIFFSNFRSSAVTLWSNDLIKVHTLKPPDNVPWFRKKKSHGLLIKENIDENLPTRFWVKMSPKL
jgi:hypothetical protein